MVTPAPRSSTKDQLTARLLRNKQVVSAGMVVFGLFAAGSYARRKQQRQRRDAQHSLSR